jgi:hypothetical protein
MMPVAMSALYKKHVSPLLVENTIPEPSGVNTGGENGGLIGLSRQAVRVSIAAARSNFRMFD